VVFSEIDCVTEVVAYEDSLVSKFLLDAQDLIQFGLEDISTDRGDCGGENIIPNVPSAQEPLS